MHIIKQLPVMHLRVLWLWNAVLYVTADGGQTTGVLIVHVDEWRKINRKLNGLKSPFPPKYISVVLVTCVRIVCASSDSTNQCTECNLDKQSHARVLWAQSRGSIWLAKIFEKSWACVRLGFDFLIVCYNKRISAEADTQYTSLFSS